MGNIIGKKKQKSLNKNFVVCNSWIILICWTKSLNVLFKHMKNYRKLCSFMQIYTNERYSRYRNGQANYFLLSEEFPFFKFQTKLSV